MWDPAFFGVKPEMVLIGGSIACAQMGDPNASIPTPQPVYTRPMFGSFGRSLEKSSVIFTSELSLENDILKNNDTKKEFVAVKNILITHVQKSRLIQKHMKLRLTEN